MRVSQQTADIRAALAAHRATGTDEPIIVEYNDGTSTTLPTLGQILEDQLKLSEFADDMLDQMFGGR